MFTLRQSQNSKRLVIKHGFDRCANYITVIVDKNKYLSPIRNIIHRERKSKTKKNDYICPGTLSGDSLITHGATYVEALSDLTFKSILLDFLSNNFVNFAQMECGTGYFFIIDSSTFDVPKCITNHSVLECNQRANEKGEADFAIWWHVQCSNCQQILIISGDTDVPMYGLALNEKGYLHTVQTKKAIIVELEFHRKYFDVLLGSIKMKEHPKLKRLGDQNNICVHVLAIYLLSGSDYISSFTKSKISKY